MPSEQPDPSGNESAATLELYLQQAVQLARPSVLIGYVAWQQSMLAGRGDDAGALRATLRGLLAGAGGDPAAEAVLRESLTILESPALEPDTFLTPDRPHAPLAREYLDLLRVGARREACNLIVRAVDGGVPLRELYLDVFQPVQWEMGRLWELNRVTVAQEHYVTAATQLVMSQLYPRLFDRPRIGRRVVVTCVAGDQHELAPRMVADFFEMEGWDSFFLGADTPHDAVVDTVVRQAADVLAVSATLTSHVTAVRDLIGAVRADREARDTVVLVGGATFNEHDALWEEIGADGTATDALEGVDRARRLTEARS